MIWTVAPAVGRGVRVALVSRRGGASEGNYRGFNVGAHSGDDPATVARHRDDLSRFVQQRGAHAVQWLDQVHGATVLQIGAGTDLAPSADGAVTRRTGLALAIMTADCVPVLLVGDGVVGALHAGWRGLAGGIIAAGVAAMGAPSPPLRAVIGPHIGGAAYEVDEPVRAAFAGDRASFNRGQPGHWWFDPGVEAEAQLRSAGVRHIDHLGGCTARMQRRWYSHRRRAPTGRNVSLIWLDGARGPRL